MPTANTIVNRALALLGVITQGETPAASESASGLAALNTMLDNWQTERLNIVSEASAKYPLVSGTVAYTMGPGGSLTTTRPLWIGSANGIVTANGQEISAPLKLMTKEEYAAVVEKSTDAVQASGIYCDYAMPTATVFVFPRPRFSGSPAPQLELYTWVPLLQFADLVTNYTLAPGYERAIAYNLAVEISAEFGAQVQPAVAATAIASKAAIRMLNAATPGAVPASGQVDAVVPQGGV